MKVQNVNRSPKYFDPETLAKIRPLGLRAKTLVEGLVAGLHRSPSRGQSLEFSHHRQYAPGDDLRQVDWKVFARSDKYYVRQYEDETNLTAMILVDQSESMEYRSNPRGLSKLEYAQLVACALTYLIVAQQDSAGVATFTDQLNQWLRPSSNPAQLEDAVQLLEMPRGTNIRSDIANTLRQCTDRLSKPHLLVLVSDLLADLPSTLKAMTLLRRAGHDCITIHVLDAFEIDFPFDRTCEFIGLEDSGALTADPTLVASAYRDAMDDLCRQAEIGCLQNNCDYFRIRTDQSLAVALPHVLSQRRGVSGRA